MQRVGRALREDCACLHIFTGFSSQLLALKKIPIIKQFVNYLFSFCKIKINPQGLIAYKREIYFTALTNITIKINRGKKKKNKHAVKLFGKAKIAHNVITQNEPM